MIRVVGDRVLVALPPAEGDITTASGLVLVRDPDAARKPTRGIVMELGEKSDSVDIEDVFRTLIDVNTEYPNDSGDLRGLKAALIEAFHALGSAAFDVAVGDCVLFPLGAGEEMELDGVRYVVIRESEIIGVLEPKEEVPA